MTNKTRNELLELILSEYTGGGGGSVLSVTGDLVDNTDPINPVVNLSASDRAILDSLPKAYIAALSNTAQTIPSGENNAAFVTNLELDNIASGQGFEIDSTIGAYKNISGRAIDAVFGVVSVHVVSSTSSESKLYFFSETSADGVVWTKNADSARQVLVVGNDENYTSKSSQFFSIPIGGYIRFRFYSDGANLSFPLVSISPGGDAVTGPAFRHWVKEL